MKKIQVPTEWGAKAFGVLLQHGIVRSVLPVEPSTYIVFDEQIEMLKTAGIPFTVIAPKGGKRARQRTEIWVGGHEPCFKKHSAFSCCIS